MATAVLRTTRCSSAATAAALPAAVLLVGAERPPPFLELKPTPVFVGGVAALCRRNCTAGLSTYTQK